MTTGLQHDQIHSPASPERPLRLLFINQSIETFNPQTGGAVSTVVYHVTKELANRGHEVLVAAPRDEHDLYPDVPTLAVDFPENRASFPVRKLYGLARRLHRYDYHLYGMYIRGLRRALRRLPDPDIVVFHNDLFMARFAARRFPSARRLLWVHNELHTNARHPDLLFDLCDDVVGISVYVREMLNERYGLAPERVAVVHNGVDVDTFRPSQPAAETGPLRVTYLGRMVHDKGPDVLVDAALALQAEGIELHVQLVGSTTWSAARDPSDAYLQMRVIPRARRAGAVWIPQQPRSRMPQILSESDVVTVLTRTSDAFPLAALEGMASGCAVVGTRTGGLPEMAGEAMELIEPDSVSDLVRILRRLATDPLLLAQRKEDCRKRSLDFTWSATVDEFVNAIGVTARTSPTGRTLP